jgi:diguanylate cyclase (GGDEF)-like protein
MNLGQLDNLIAEIRRVSFSDDKTILGNALALEYEENLINEGKSEYDVFVFGDLNDFKQLNDEHGYAAGDVAIRVAGETLSKIVVGELQAKAFRKSGDEFVILLRQNMVIRFLPLASTFADIQFSQNEKELTTSMSFGYVFGDGKTSFEDLLRRAEDACKQAKVQGNGSCIEWTEDIKLNHLVRKGGRCKQCGARVTCNVPQQNAPVELKGCPCCGGPLE